MADLVGAVDQGTTSTRFMLFDHGGNEVGRHQLEHEQILPRAGRGEHSPVEIWERTRSVGAIYAEPFEHPDGRLTCADDAKCLPFFATHDGCTICVAVCPFNTAGYERVHQSVLASGHRQAVAEHTGGASAADA